MLFHLTPGKNHQRAECKDQCRVAQGIEHDADETATEELLRCLLDPEGTKVIRKYEVDEIDREGQTAEGADHLRCPRWNFREHQDEGADGDGLQATEHPTPAGVVVICIQCSDVLPHLQSLHIEVLLQEEERDAEQQCEEETDVTIPCLGASV